MTISIERNSDFAERRRECRNPLTAEVSFRERGRSAMKARLVDLNSFGCCVEGMILVRRDAQLWIRLPGLENLPVQLAWTDGARFGFRFDTPLHPAVADRFMPVEGSHAAAAPEQTCDNDNQMLSRREQILSGITGSDLSPLQRRKQPTRLGLLGRISRLISRQADHRSEPRYDDAVAHGSSLVVAGRPVRVVNVSQSGIKVHGNLGRNGIGDRVALEFENFCSVTGQVVWMKGQETGIALPPQSIEVVERAED